MSKTETQSDEQKFSKEDLQMIEALGDQSLYGADAMEKRWSGETQSKALLYAELLERYLIQSEFAGDIAHGAAELLRRLDAEDKRLNIALDEWMEKTDWVQQTIRPRELGMHRADVLRARIEALDAENKALRADAGRYHHLRDCNSGSLVVMQITGTGEDDWHVLTEGDADEAIDTAMAAAKTGDAA